MLRLLNGVLLSAILFVGLLVLIATLGAHRFAMLTRPNSQGYVSDVIELKARVAASIPGRKLVVVSGSGGLYSISCAVMEAELRMPCVNEGLPIEVGLPGILEQGRSAAKPGDVILMPMEYPAYYVEAYGGGSARRSEAGLANKIRSADLRRLFRVDLTYVVSAIAERVMWASGYRAYSIRAMFAPNGDRIGHTAAAGEEYSQRRGSHPPASYRGVITDGFRANMTDFLEWAQRNDIKVVATLQPTYRDMVVPSTWLSDMARFYQERNTIFFAPDDLYKYDRDCFFDGEPHLNVEWQQIHSRKIARDIGTFLPTAERQGE